MKTNSYSAFYLSFLLVTLAGTMAAEFHEHFIRKHTFPSSRTERLTHIRVYLHDIVSGRNRSSEPITFNAPSNNNSSTTNSAARFGQMFMMDDLLTAGPDLDSQLLGKAQGLFAFASQQEIGLLMCMNFVFISGRYNGSTLTILGRNTIFSQVREMPVVGGSGLFRWARGYAEARTHSFDLTSKYAVVQYNIYVQHY